MSSAAYILAYYVARMRLAANRGDADLAIWTSNAASKAAALIGAGC
jgi:hypothetical protein